MKIVIGADQYPEYINGAARFTDRLARGLAHRGHQVSVIWPSADGPSDSYHDAGLDVHRLKSYRLPRANGLRISPRTSGRQIDAVLAAVKPDVVHIQSHIFIGRRLAQAARQGGYPLVATNHFMPENIVGHIPLLHRSNPVVSRWAWRDLFAVYGLADLVTAPTPRAVQLLSSAAGLTAEAISCGIDAERFRPLPASTRTSTGTGTGTGTGNAIPTVLFVGRLETEKRLDELLHAFAAIPVAQPARLHVVGTGTQAHQLKALAHDLQLGDRIVLSGRADDAELVAAYRGADVFCMPGTAELQSLATLEAMSAGLPVVAADAMALPHLVNHGHNGYLFTPGHTRQLTGHLTTLLRRPDLRQVFGLTSRAMAEQHSVEHTLDTFEDRYAEVARRRASRILVAPARRGPSARQRGRR